MLKSLPANEGVEEGKNIMLMHDISGKITWAQSTCYCSICAGNKSPYTWEQVLKVLYQPAVGGDRVADELKEKYGVP